MATLWYRNRFCFLFFFFSQIYRIDGGCVVLSVQLSEHVTIDQGRLNQSGIDTLRSLDRALALSIAVLSETENLLALQCRIYVYTYFPMYVYVTPM